MVKRKHAGSKKPHEWQWTLRQAAFRETGNWTSLPVASERNWGEGVCIVGIVGCKMGGQLMASGESFPVPLRGDEETGWHFRQQKRVFQGCFVVVVFFFGFCLFVCFKTLLMHTTTWHQYPALPRTNEMTTGPIMVPDGNKRNSPLVNCWFSLYSGLPLSSQTSFNLENVSNQWWASGWGS